MLIGTSEANVAFTTMISMASMVTVGRFLNYMAAHDVGAVSQSEHFRLQTSLSQRNPIYQPLVQTQCEVHDMNAIDTPANLDFSSDSINCFGDARCTALLRGNWEYYVPVLPRNISHADTHEYAFRAPKPNETFSLRALFRLPYIEEDLSSIWLITCAPSWPTGSRRRSP